MLLLLIQMAPYHYPESTSIFMYFLSTTPRWCPLLWQQPALVVNHYYWEMHLSSLSFSSIPYWIPLSHCLYEAFFDVPQGMICMNIMDHTTNTTCQWTCQASFPPFYLLLSWTLIHPLEPLTLSLIYPSTVPLPAVLLSIPFPGAWRRSCSSPSHPLNYRYPLIGAALFHCCLHLLMCIMPLICIYYFPWL